MRAVGYVRVSTADQAERGASLAAQKAAITAECERKGWELVEFASDAVSAKSTRRRPGFTRALERCEAREFDVLVVTMMDRAFRSSLDFWLTLDRATRSGWQLRMLDPDVDVGTPFGEAMAGMAAVYAQLERRLIAQRTRNGIAEKKRAGTYRGGLVAHPPEVEPDAARRMAELAADDLSSRQIARRLTIEGYAPPRGDVWSHSTVLKTLRRAA